MEEAAERRSVVGVGVLAFEFKRKQNTARASKASAGRQLKVALFIPPWRHTLKRAIRSKYTLRRPLDRRGGPRPARRGGGAASGMSSCSVSRDARLAARF